MVALGAAWPSSFDGWKDALKDGSKRAGLGMGRVVSVVSGARKVLKENTGAIELAIAASTLPVEEVAVDFLIGHFWELRIATALHPPLKERMIGAVASAIQKSPGVKRVSAAIDRALDSLASHLLPPDTCPHNPTPSPFVCPKQ